MKKNIEPSNLMPLKLIGDSVGSITKKSASESYTFFPNSPYSESTVILSIQI